MSPNWRQRALCLDADPSIFHPGAPGDQPEKAGDPAYEPAKRICARCPVRDECLEDALANRDPWGVRGGLDPWERVALLRRSTQPVRRRSAASPTAADNATPDATAPVPMTVGRS
jgi:WhiB family transcriptional regulator, redox-sensing transcriptional regulator